MKQQFYLWLLCVAFLTAASPALLKAQEKITGAVNPPNSITLTPASAGEQNYYCPSDDMFKKYLDENPEARARWEESEARYRANVTNPNMRQWINSASSSMRTNTSPCRPGVATAGWLTIPVVFHLIRGTANSPAFLTLNRNYAPSNYLQ